MYPEPGYEEILEQVRAIYADILEVPQVAPDDDIIILGGDSVQAVQIALELEMRLGVEISLGLLEEKGGRVDAVAAFIAGRRAGIDA
jgi:acyl carrier protein